jgi:hypothetical protein
MNYLVSAEAAAGHSCQLAQALRNYIPLESVYFNKSHFECDWVDPDAKIGEFPAEGDILIIVTTIAYKQMKPMLGNFNRVIIIIPDSIYIYNWEGYNEEFLPYEVLMSNCTMQYREGYPTKVYYQPFDLSPWMREKKWSKLTFCHSPFVGRSMAKKGTIQIIETLIRNNLKFEIINGLPWNECLERKAKCHVFIDQIDTDPALFPNAETWKGGLGKSGMEAMLLGCYTITRGNFKDYDIPAPPVVECTSETFEKVLLESIEIDRQPIINAQYDWAVKYTNPDFCARRVLNL